MLNGCGSGSSVSAQCRGKPGPVAEQIPRYLFPIKFKINHDVCLRPARGGRGCQRAAVRRRLSVSRYPTRDHPRDRLCRYAVGGRPDGAGPADTVDTKIRTRGTHIPARRPLRPMLGLHLDGQIADVAVQRIGPPVRDHGQGSLTKLTGRDHAGSRRRQSDRGAGLAPGDRHQFVMIGLTGNIRDRVVRQPAATISGERPFGDTLPADLADTRSPSRIPSPSDEPWPAAPTTMAESQPDPGPDLGGRIDRSATPEMSCRSDRP